MLLLFLTATIAVAKPSKQAPRGVAGAVRTAKRDRQVLRFFANHAWLLTDRRFSTEAKRQIRLHRHSLASAERVIAAARRTHAATAAATTRVLAMEVPETPAATICRVFGRYCEEALQVALCESHFHTGAQNGQYLGLFQMGTLARRLYGHGASADRQAKAAHRYFVASGRDWSPWSCRPR